jgi:hypothetical protein
MKMAGWMRVIAVAVLLGGMVAQGWGQQSYTYPQLVDRMTNMALLARLPAQGEKTSLASSYDRKSRYDAATDKYIEWDANADGNGNMGKIGDDVLLADIKGPGVIMRIWSATAGAGHVKIYLEGAETPTVDLPFTAYFDRSAAPFNRKNLVYGLQPEAPGFDNFTPIGFAKSCRIVAEKGWGAYYQFTYTQFPEGTKVPTFQMNLSAEDAAALDRTDKILGSAGEMTPGPKASVKTMQVEAEPGKETPVVKLSGAGAITALTVKLDLPKDPEKARRLLSELTLSMTWDGETAPAVWTPLGDFFGYVGGAKPFRSLPVGLRADGTFYSIWYMPYAKKAQIAVGNGGAAAVPMTWTVTREPLNEPIAKLARFHAKWHRDAFLPTRPDRAIDWTLLTTEGSGRYVGTHLHGVNPIGGWWGEGDDKFFVDGEKFPSSFGTGSEDYFGFAWSSGNTFSRPYHGQLLNEGNQGHFDDNRWHIADSDPFHTSFEADIEKYFPNEWETLYAATAFWYLNAMGTDPYTAVPTVERVGYWKMNLMREPGVSEGVMLRVMNQPTTRPSSMFMTKYGPAPSVARQMYWRAKLGDTMDLLLQVPASGRYLLVLHCTDGPDYGLVKVSVDGNVVKSDVDLYAANVKPAEPISTDALALTKGDHKLTIEVTGKNPVASGSSFGLVSIKLEPVK